MHEKFTRWYLSRFLDQIITSMSDEFVADGFRVRLRSNTLELTFEAPGQPSSIAARAVAEKYAAVLEKHLARPMTLMTEGEYLELFATIMMNTVVARGERERAARAIREARNELLASADQALRRCYDYLQNAKEHEVSAIFDLYKAIETVENALGGEGRAGVTLGVMKEIKALKKSADVPTGDERHAPKDPASTPPRADLGQAWENTLAVVRAWRRSSFAPSTWS